MTLAFATLSLCALALAAWWFVWTMHRATLRFRGDMYRYHGAMFRHNGDIADQLQCLYERLGYDTEKTGLEEPPTTEDKT